MQARLDGSVVMCPVGLAINGEESSIPAHDSGFGSTCVIRLCSDESASLQIAAATKAFSRGGFISVNVFFDDKTLGLDHASLGDRKYGFAVDLGQLAHHGPNP